MRTVRIVFLSAVAILVGYLLLLLIVAIGAGESERGVWLIVNETNHELRILRVTVSGEERPVDRVPSAGRRSIIFSCGSHFVARNQAGELVARWDGTDDCSNDDPWVITD